MTLIAMQCRQPEVFNTALVLAPHKTRIFHALDEGRLAVRRAL